MPTTVNAATGWKLAKAICDANGIDATMTRRVVLDIRSDDVAVLYVEMLASTKTVSIDWADVGATVKVETLP